MRDGRCSITIRGKTTLEDVKIARRWSTRLVGMMREKGRVPQGKAMLFPKCGSVHMMFMHAPLDIVAIDADSRVIGVDTVRPWKRVPRHRGCRTVLEMRDGEAAERGIAAGTKIGYKR